jgi:hypothetical protein
MPARPALGPPGAVPPRGWGSRINYDDWNDAYTADDSIGVHHGGGGDYPAGLAPFTVDKETAQLRSWERYHVETKGWRGIAYGWAGGQTGELYRLRTWNTYGAHPGDVDADHISNNAEVLPYLFILDGEHQKPSTAALQTFETWRAWVEETLQREMYTRGHRELKGTATTCPGRYLQAYVATHRITEEIDMMDKATFFAWLDEWAGVATRTTHDGKTRRMATLVTDGTWAAGVGRDEKIEFLSTVLVQARNYAQQAAKREIPVATIPAAALEAAVADAIRKLKLEEIVNDEAERRVRTRLGFPLP